MSCLDLAMAFADAFASGDALTITSSLANTVYHGIETYNAAVSLETI